MTAEPCGVHNCVRVLGHAGAHCCAPSARTLDWDHDRAPAQQEQVAAAASLLMLDFETPAVANLHDDWADLPDPPDEEAA